MQNLNYICMIPMGFEYFRPQTLDDALNLLSEYEGEAKILAGGQSLIPLLKLRLLSPKYLIDIGRIQSLSYIREKQHSLEVGCLVRHRELEAFEAKNVGLQMLADAASSIGDPQIRNIGTFGGSLAHADPSADWTAVTLTLNARIKLISLSGEREVMAEDFFTGSFSTALRPDEILAGVEIPLRKGRVSSCYQKLKRKAGDFATVGSAVLITFDQSGTCSEAGIALTSVADRPVKVRKAEELLKGRKVEDGIINEVCDVIKESINPPSDIRGSSEYRREMAAVITKRAIFTAIGRISGG